MLTDQFTHHPDARYWIPTINEYTKGAYWDPHKHGPSQGGYWLMPDGGDEQLIAGPPGVGEAAGDWWQGPGWTIDTGLYPDTQSPWGMIDVSSTYNQFTEGVVHPSIGTARMLRGSIAGSLSYASNDRMDHWNHAVVMGGNFSIRIATSIPGPSALGVLGMFGLFAVNRRSRPW